MRKYIFAVSIIILISVLFIGCSREKDSIITDNELGIFTYDLENVTSFTVDEDGLLYATTENGSLLYCVDKDGSLLKEYEIGDGINSNLCSEGDYIYCFSYLEHAIVIKQLNTITGAVNEFMMEQDITSVINMEVIDDNAYYIRWGDYQNEEQQQVRFDEQDNYYYMGESAAVYNLETQSSTPLDIPNVIRFARIDQDNLLFYAYDGIGGYYFVTYDTQQQEFGDKTYNNDMGQIFSFAYDTMNEQILYAGSSARRLYLAGKQDASVKAELMTDVATFSGNDLRYLDEYTYILDNSSRKVSRIDNSKILKSNKALKIYQPSYYPDIPPGCGYNIDSETISSESFALTVQAGDSDYDLCFMSSDHGFSRSLRDKEVFYPLEDVPGVMEYLDSCFPYIKEAATSESGNIWMIPIVVDANCIVYHEANCIDEGINVKDADSIQKLTDIARTLYNNPENRNRYGFPSGRLQENAIAQYIDFYGMQDNEANFDTPLFRELCIQLKEIILSDDISSMLYQAGEVGHENYYDNYLLDLLIYKFRMYNETAYQVLKARPLPSIEPGIVHPNSVICLYLCVNPYSDHLDDALNYISDLCATLSTQMDNFMLQDLKYYSYNDSELTKGLYDIYANGIVTFPLSSEIFWNDYLSYLNGEIELDALITEIERKVNAYLKE